jgi:hypothetical protein
MLDAFFLKKAFNLRVFELRPIVASYLFLFLIRTHFEPVSRIPLRSLGFVIFLQKEHPSEARIIIHNYKTVLTRADAYVSYRAEYIHFASKVLNEML